MESNLKKVIKKAIEDHFESNPGVYDFIDNLDSGYSEEEIYDDLINCINIPDLVEKINNEIKKEEFVFSTNDYMHSICTACGKPFGVFKSDRHGEVGYSLFKDGKKIIIVDE